jgi:transcriptional regulator with XRE-family HTH domain
MEKMFGELLLTYREYAGLTQKGLAEELSYWHESFQGLNAVTISRWETGTTTPGISKKREVLKFLAHQGCLTDRGCLPRFIERYKLLQRHLTEIFNRQYQYIVGNYPDFGEEEYRISPLL